MILLIERTVFVTEVYLITHYKINITPLCGINTPKLKQQNSFLKK